MRKNYILDTNVLIDDPYSIFNFEENTVYIPVYVLEELDKIKTETNSIRGKAARTACRILDDLGKQGDLAKGIEIPGNNCIGMVIIYIPKERKRINVGLDENSMDNAILQAAIEISDSNKNIITTFVTNDVNLRVRAQVVGLIVESYEHNSVDSEKLITGMIDVNVERNLIDTLSAEKALDAEFCKGVYENVCINLICKETGQSLLARYSGNMIRTLRVPKEGILGIRPKNKEQHFALDLLLDDTVSIVTLVGSSGSGKTLLAICAGLSKVLENKYKRLLVSRPVVPMGGKDNVGFLPGSITEKMDPYMQPIYDNLEMLSFSNGKKRGWSHEEMFEDGTIKIEPLTYIRGRSIANQFMIVDEAQGLNALETKTIITRCGENTKIILTGDPDQIDNPYLDKSNCGINIVVEKFHNHDIVGHIALRKGERSPLANLAASIL
jgi:PhoH-like ATPase